MLSTSLLILDVDLDHLAQVVFVRFLHLKITLSISYSWRHVVIPWGWCIYINHLEFFFMQNLFYAFTYSFQHMCVCGVCVGVCVHVLTQLYPTLCDPMKCGQPGSSVHGISQARILEWVAVSYSRGTFQPRDQTRISYSCRQILYLWAIWEAPCISIDLSIIILNLSYNLILFYLFLSLKWFQLWLPGTLWKTLIMSI